jgi:hypothetical protein
MLISDSVKFASILAATATVYAKSITSEHAETLFKVFGDYSIEEIENAFMAHMKIGKFFPVPADIIGLIPKKRKEYKKGDKILSNGRWLTVLN